MAIISIPNENIIWNVNWERTVHRMNSLRNKRSRERVVQLTNGPSFDCSFGGTNRPGPVTELQHETSCYVADQFTKITDENFRVSNILSEVAFDELK